MTRFIEINPKHVIKPRRHVNRFFIHCSASDSNGPAYVGTALSETIHRWHLDRKWAGIGYHYTVDRAGRLMTGRNLETTPAAQGGHNRSTLALCIHGLSVDLFTDVQKMTLFMICKQYNKMYGGKITFHGHCEVSAKTCPVLDYKQILGLDKNGKMPL